MLNPFKRKRSSATPSPNIQPAPVPSGQAAGAILCKPDA